MHFCISLYFQFSSMNIYVYLNKFLQPEIIIIIINFEVSIIILIDVVALNNTPKNTKIRSKSKCLVEVRCQNKTFYYGVAVIFYKIICEQLQYLHANDRSEHMINPFHQKSTETRFLRKVTQSNTHNNIIVVIPA